MFSYDLLIPWITLIAVLVPLLYVQRWIHRHVFGVGYLISREKQAATLFYYLFLLPGVVLHELSAYLMAGIFNIPSTRFTLYPEAQEDGSLESGFVQLEEVKNPVFAAFIGIAPLLTGMLVVVIICNSLLDLPAFFAQLQTGDFNKIGPAIQILINKPDFIMWTYILFAVANAMMPNKEDRRGWWYVGGALVVLLLFMVFLGLGRFVVNWLAGPISSTLYSLSAVFGIVLALDCLGMCLIWVLESGLERLTGHRVEYAPTKAVTVAQPARPTIHSVYELNLPLPPIPGKVVASPAKRLPPATERPALGGGTPVERPAIAASSGQSGSGPARPALGSGSSERPAPSALPARPAAGSASALAGSRATGTTPTPFGQSPKPATASTGDQAEKPASATGQPSKPGFGQPSRPGGAFGQPPKPATASTGDQPEKPASTTGQPSKPGFGQPSRPGGAFGQPPKPATASTGDQPEKPASTTGQPSRPGFNQPSRPGGAFGQSPKPATASTGDQSQRPASPTGQPSKPGFGQPARPGGAFGQPSRPPMGGTPASGTTSGDTGKGGSTPPQPAKPGSPFGQPSRPPIGGPPAVVRPGGPAAPAGSKPPMGGAAKPFGSSPGSSGPSRPLSRPFNKDDDDVIDADVIDEEDEEEEPGFMKGVNKPSGASKPRPPFGTHKDEDEDDNEPKYVDMDDV